MNLQIDVQRACAEPVPEEEDIRRAISAALSHHYQNTAGNAEVSVRLVSEAEMSELNAAWRGQHKSTNVLSFPADLPADLEHPLLGDIVICAAVVRREARDQNKTDAAHWNHMLVHGSLHLLGYDHQLDAEAEAMENMETLILEQLGYPCPYQGQQQIDDIRSLG
jgi:probable rRNA maturation factor